MRHDSSSLLFAIVMKGGRLPAFQKRLSDNRGGQADVVEHQLLHDRPECAFDVCLVKGHPFELG